MTKRRTWKGGYIRTTKAGRSIYVIERWARGRRVHVSTGMTSKDAAERELARFELDPLRYRPGVVIAADAVKLDADLVLAYHAHQLANGITKEWADEVARCLADWTVALAGRDLRALHLHFDLKAALEQWPTQKPHRIKAIKGLFRWLREEKGLVDRNQDVTIDLKVPKGSPEKNRRKKVVEPEVVAAVLRHLAQPTRDILYLLSGTGWHQSEVRRLWESGEITELLRPNDEGVIAVLHVKHKSGDTHATSLQHRGHLEAAKRIKALKTFPTRMTISRHMKAAREAAGVAYFGTGQMRHSALTWGRRDGGAAVAEVSTFAGHRSEQTTKRYYLDLDVPKAIPVYDLA